MTDSQRYSAIKSKSSHGLFTIDEEEEDTVEIALQQTEETDNSPTPKFPYSNFTMTTTLYFLWDLLTFAWMKPLLTLGNTRALEQSDLYALPISDKAASIYIRFREKWELELLKHKKADITPGKDSNSRKASLSNAFIGAFGWPFLAAGFLKLIHDSCLFVGPMLLNSLINLLSDPTKPASTGYYYVLGLFLANFTMSLCLRQYFWWCFRVGMNLRSAVITAVYQKSMVISAAALHTKSSGEITNLMSVDATRLQELTPYLHAIWYSFYQIVIAMYLLWGQMGPSCLAGFVVIVGTIPLTGKITTYMKTLQKAMSTVRDERIKMSNEVLAGMKVIKLQAWEDEYRKRIDEIRTRELSTFRNYVISQAMSGALYTTIPLMVGIFTFTAYIASGHTLDVATALTSLALFEILRFPLFMLPNVMNNIVEARVSVDRVQAYLLESEKQSVPTQPLREPGVLMEKASLVWERTKSKAKPPSTNAGTGPTGYLDAWKKIYNGIKVGMDIMGEWKDSIRAKFSGETRPRRRQRIVHHEEVDNPLLGMKATGGHGFRQIGYTHSQVASMSPEEYATALMHAQLWESENKIEELEKQLALLRKQGDAHAIDSTENEDTSTRSTDAIHEDSVDEGIGIELSLMSKSSTNDGSPSSVTCERLLALSRVSLKASPGHLIAIVGQVGAGKSSLLGAVLGDMKICFGGIARKGRVAYVGQRPFIQNSTLKDNITFGMEFDDDRYQKTLAQSALIPDLQVLPGGDMTEIGERGINLSGGQKARVALARAVYYDADVYLLDDPLAAVDAHVGQHLFQQCIVPLQKRNKCILLVTNALQYVKFCSKILVIRNGRVVEEGSFDDLLQNKSHFMEMMAAFQDSKDDVQGFNVSAGLTPEPGSSSPMEQSTGNTEKDDGDDADINNKTKTVAEGQSSAIAITKSSSSVKETSAKGQKSSPEKAGALIAAEDREVGDVSTEVYLDWVRAAGGLSAGVGMIVLYFAGEAISLVSSWWLSYWSAHREYASPWYFLAIYVLFNIGVVIFSFSRDIYGRLIALRASKLLFNDLLSAVLYAPMVFFDTNPLGRIVNRFSKDIYTIDEQIPQTSRGYLGTMYRVIGVLVYICIISPMFIVLLIPICLFYRISQRYYIKTSRELTRLDSTSRSPIFALFSETLDGLSTIRAFQSESRFLAKNNALLDANQQAYFLNFSANCWLAVRLELAGTLIVTSAALLAVVAKAYQGIGVDGVGNTVEEDGAASAEQARVAAFAGLAGLSISMALSVTQALNWSVRMASDLESQMVSVERVKSYSSMPQEAAHHTARDPPPYWPSEGMIEMRNVHMRYRAGLPLVLRGVNLTINAREKIGVVGRTGAGKSSLLTVFLRLVELESGTVIVDGVDLSTIGLNALRSRIAVIPQDPVLFSGTIRSNLDPFRKYSDLELWESLRRTTLAASISSLEDAITENGANFSVGQRQLLCISRALLSKSKIIIMDEATAAVDVETDAAIQKSIREEFAYATCLTVAHRLNTIMDSDKVLVMEQGQVAEFDTPANLLSPNRSTPSMFAALVAHWDDDDSH